MKIEIIQDPAAFQAMAGEWNALLTESASHVPFLRHEYLSAWWKTLGGGEWANGSLCLVTARDANGRLVGIAPLFASPNREGEAALLLLGSIEISDYLDLIARPEDLPAFIDALLETLGSLQEPAWQVLDLYNLVDSSPTLALLQEAAVRRGWHFSQEQLQHCPTIPLPGDWETYLAGIDKKQRHEIRRKIRRAEESDATVRWYIVEDEASLDREMDDFLALMSQDPDKDVFLTEVMRSQMRGAVHAAFQAGWLQLAFLEIDGQKAAGYLNFDYENSLWVYNSGLNFALREYSPGWVLLGYLLRWANEHGRSNFDFMRGNEDYKYRFGAVDRFVMRARVKRN